MRKYLLVLLAFLASMSSQSQNSPVPKTQGLLWEITGNGLSKPSYLYGTMHISGKLAFNLSDSFYLAIKSVNTVALELDPSLWLMQMMEQRDASNSRETMPNEYNFGSQSVYKSAYLSLFGRDEVGNLLKIRPEIANSMLYRTGSSGESDDHEEDTYLDLFIYQIGKKYNKQLIGIEDYIQSEILVNRAYQYESQYTEEELEKFREESRFKIEQLMKLYDKNLGEIRDDAYRSGDLDLLDSIARLQSPQYFMRYMLYERNKLMAQNMDSVMRKGTLFTAVGAGHLPGEQGVIALLRAKGYTVRPVTFNSSHTDKQRKAIEKIKYPVDVFQQYSKDSTFSFVAPKTLIQTTETEGVLEYLHNDMANGAYYFILEVPHHAAFINKSLSDTWLQVDSAIYENVPGKIISRKKIYSNNGWQGFDIVSKTRHGDVQRTQLFVGPYAYYLFLMSGQLNYVEGKEGNAFFNSIKFSPKSGDKWTVFSPTTGGFEVKMPDLRTVTQSHDNFNGNNRLVIESADIQNQYFYFSESIDQNIEELEEDTFELNYIIEEMAYGFNANMIESHVDSKSKVPTSYGVFEMNGAKIYVRASLFGNRYYTMATNAVDEKTRNLYFESFSIKPFIYSGTPVKYYDSLLFFYVSQIPNTNPYKSTLEDVTGYSSLGIRTKKIMAESEFESNESFKRIPNKETGEFVEVSFVRDSRFNSYKAIDSMWKNRTSSYKDNSMYWIKNRKDLVYNDSIREFIMADTNCSRGIYVKMFSKCKSYYTLTSVIDLNSPISDFVKRVYTSFTPYDTCFGGSVLDDNIEKDFIPNLYSKDSTMFNKVRNIGQYRNYITFEPKHLNVLMNTISDTSFHNLPMNLKEVLMDGFSDIKSSASNSFLGKMYVDYSDSSEIQYAILDALAKMKQPAANQLLIKLLSNDLPIDGSGEGMERLISSLQDSLPIAAKLVPDLLKFTKYAEYKNSIYDLVSSLIDSGLINSLTLAAYKKEILNDAVHDIKVLDYFDKSNTYSNAYVNRYSSSEYFSANSSFVRLPISKEARMVLNYVRILSLFKQDQDVKKYFDRVYRSENVSIRLPALIYLSSKQVAIPDSNWAIFASRPEYRKVAYQYLKHYKLLSAHPNICKSGQEMAEAIIADEFRFNSFKDTMAFVQSFYLTIKGDSGVVYVYKVKHKEDIYWNAIIVGLQPQTGDKFKLYSDICDGGDEYETEEQLNVQMKDWKRMLRTLNRKKCDSNMGLFPMAAFID